MRSEITQAALRRPSTWLVVMTRADEVDSALAVSTTEIPAAFLRIAAVTVAVAHAAGAGAGAEAEAAAASAAAVSVVAGAVNAAGTQRYARRGEPTGPRPWINRFGGALQPSAVKPMCRSTVAA
mmetsp:Transcript_83971/g.234327  ORF Transcript_83971/g.234327 Transcript_83971/m.234327 type:complete len:124 (+) Transcript_83971:530-901(+)